MKKEEYSIRKHLEKIEKDNFDLWILTMCSIFLIWIKLGIGNKVMIVLLGVVALGYFFYNHFKKFSKKKNNG